MPKKITIMLKGANGKLWMRISKLKIENFRSIEDIELNFNSLNCIIGANNTGQSNILLAIKKALESLQRIAFTSDDIFMQNENKNRIIL